MCSPPLFNSLYRRLKRSKTLSTKFISLRLLLIFIVITALHDCYFSVRYFSSVKKLKKEVRSWNLHQLSFTLIEILGLKSSRSIDWLSRLLYKAHYVKHIPNNPYLTLIQNLEFVAYLWEKKDCSNCWSVYDTHNLGNVVSTNIYWTIPENGANCITCMFF